MDAEPTARPGAADSPAAAAGTTDPASTYGDRLTALTALLGPMPMAIVPLIAFHDELRVRLRCGRPGGGVAILAEVTTAISHYLADERDLGRIAGDTDIDSVTLSLVGGNHLLFADRDPDPPDSAAVHKLVTAVIADAVQRRPA